MVLTAKGRINQALGRNEQLLPEPPRQLSPPDESQSDIDDAEGWDGQTQFDDDEETAEHGIEDTEGAVHKSPDAPAEIEPEHSRTQEDVPPAAAASSSADIPQTGQEQEQEQEQEHIGTDDRQEQPEQQYEDENQEQRNAKAAKDDQGAPQPVPDDSEKQQGELSTQQQPSELLSHLTEAERNAILAPLVKRLEDAEAATALWIEVSSHAL